jgi:hypothetical protein
LLLQEAQRFRGIDSIDILITDNAAQQRQRCGIKVAIADAEAIRGSGPHFSAWVVHNAPQCCGSRRQKFVGSAETEARNALQMGKSRQSVRAEFIDEMIGKDRIRRSASIRHSH